MVSPANSDEDSVFTDAEEQNRRVDGGPGGRATRRISVQERVHGLERPPASPSMSQKRRRVSSHGHQPSAGLDDLALSQIKGLIETGNAVVIHKLEKLEAKFESLEKRLSILEHDSFETAARTDTTERKIEHLESENRALRDQLTSIDTNIRQDSLILKSNDFGQRSVDEDVEEKAIRTLNAKFEWLNLKRSDIQVAHRLQTDNTVICKFMQRSIRDRIYDGRFRQNTREAGNRLFITESLSAPNREIMNILLSAKREGRIYTCFTRRGCPFFKETFTSSSRRATSLQQLQPLLDAPLPRPTQPPVTRSAGPREGRGGGRAGGVWRGGPPPGAAGPGADRPPPGGAGWADRLPPGGAGRVEPLVIPPAAGAPRAPVPDVSAADPAGGAAGGDAPVAPAGPAVGGPGGGGDTVDPDEPPSRSSVPERGTVAPGRDGDASLADAPPPPPPPDQ